MSKTPESREREKVHDHLPNLIELWRQSMSGTLTDGTPDHWYIGPRGSIWIEWKWTRSKNPHTYPNVSTHQRRWLRRAFSWGETIAVIEACPIGFRIYPGITWVVDEYTFKLPQPVDAAACATWILHALRRKER